MKIICNRSASASHQRGVAAIEFGLIFGVLFLFFYGVATFGAVLYMQQVVSRAAGDGARAVSHLQANTIIADDPRIREAVYHSLAGSFIAGATDNATMISRRSWIDAQVSQRRLIVNVTESIVTGESIGTTNVIVTVTYPYSDQSGNRILPTLPLLKIILPEQLNGRATAAIQSS